MPTFKVDVPYLGVWTALVEADDEEAASDTVQALAGDPDGDPSALPGYADTRRHLAPEVRPCVPADEANPTCPPDYVPNDTLILAQAFDQVASEG